MLVNLSVCPQQKKYLDIVSSSIIIEEHVHISDVVIIRNSVKQIELIEGRQEFMKSKILPIGVVILMMFIMSAYAADVAGKWMAQAPSGQGTSEITLVFKVDGTTLTGTLDNSQMPGAIEIKDGKIQDDDISFHVLRSFGENEMKVVWKGKVSGDEIRFTRGIEGGMMGGGPGGPGSGAGAGGGTGGGGAETEIIAKRAE
jgi:uncharacterized membrane protein YgcG